MIKMDSRLISILLIVAVINLFILFWLTRRFKFEKKNFSKALLTIIIGVLVSFIISFILPRNPFYIRELLWSIVIIFSLKYFYEVGWKSSLKVWIILFITGIIVEAILSLFMMGLFSVSSFVP